MAASILTSALDGFKLAVSFAFGGRALVAHWLGGLASLRAGLHNEDNFLSFSRIETQFLGCSSRNLLYIGLSYPACNS
jgi:hypothetical protein